MKRVAIYTANKRLGRKFELILRFYATVDVLAEDDNSDGYSKVFVDCESYPELSEIGIALPYTNNGGKIRTLPFLHEDIISLVESAEETARERTLKLEGDSRSVSFGEERISLTELEYKLLAILLSKDGFVDRQTLLRSVWGNNFEGGVLTVYIHYLREKLEAGGERVILTSRTHGYAIDKKYRG